MDNLYKIDIIFDHELSTSGKNTPKFFKWNQYDKNSEYVFLTDFSLEEVNNLNGTKALAWIIESPLFAKVTKSINYVKENQHKFQKVYTFHKELLSISDKFEFIPIGGCWINPEDRMIHQKDKLVSIIASHKCVLPGHKLRHKTVSKFRDGIDVFGDMYNFILNKITGLKDYMFSIAIENCQSDYYFTEKLIDCFVTGTIPIYWGCPSIGQFFNTEGFIIFNTIEELEGILNTISPDLYRSKERFIRENYELSMKYLVADDLLYEKFQKEFLTQKRSNYVGSQ